MDIKGEIDVNRNVNKNKNLICMYIKYGMGNLFIIKNINCVIIILVQMMEKVHGDIQDIHENCFNWYLRHEY